MRSAILRMMRAGASVAATVAGLFYALAVAVDIWRGKAPVDAAGDALPTGLALGGGAFALGILLQWVTQACPNCWLPTATPTGLTRSEYDSGDLSSSGRVTWFEVGCANCGHREWIAHTDD